MIVPFEPWHLVVITPQPHQIGSIRTEQHAGNIASVGAFTCLHNGQPVAIGGIVPAEKYGLVFDSGIGCAWMIICKRAARTVLTGMCYSVGSATRQGSSSLTRFIGQSAMTSRT